MFEVRQTEVFSTWLHGLRDDKGRALIAERLLRLEAGHFGDIDNLGDGIVELRIHYGPGYRLYCVRRARVVIVLLCGGTKRTQKADIKEAKKLARKLE
jgi:putative addiction module killer protein